MDLLQSSLCTSLLADSFVLAQVIAFLCVSEIIGLIAGLLLDLDMHA